VRLPWFWLPLLSTSSGSAEWRSIVLLSAEDRFEALEARIAELEARRSELTRLVETSSHDQGVSGAKAELQGMENEIAALRTRAATYTSHLMHAAHW
jgi:uncharacterized protein involved in exopolysaccharide biosynthesis